MAKLHNIRNWKRDWKKDWSCKVTGNDSNIVEKTSVFKIVLISKYKKQDKADILWVTQSIGSYCVDN